MTKRPSENGGRGQRIFPQSSPSLPGHLTPPFFLSSLSSSPVLSLPPPPPPPPSRLVQSVGKGRTQSMRQWTLPSPPLSRRANGSGSNNSGGGSGNSSSSSGGGSGSSSGNSVASSSLNDEALGRGGRQGGERGRQAGTDNHRGGEKKGEGELLKKCLPFLPQSAQKKKDFQMQLRASLDVHCPRKRTVSGRSSAVTYIF